MKKKFPLKQIRHSWQLYAMLALPVLFLLLFTYLPIYGAQIAFKDYNPMVGIWGSKWVGFKHFIKLFSSHMFYRYLANTFILSFYDLLVSFPFPIILAISLNSIGNNFIRRTAQTITYAPYFISVVVMVSMLIQFLSVRTGVVNTAVAWLGFKPIDFLATPAYFRSIYVFSGVWQNTGFSAIIYLAALASVDPQLYEAATIDGASKFRRIIHIDLPSLFSTMLVLLILRAGQVLNIGYEKILLMQNPLNLSKSEIISSFVYKTGLASAMVNYSFPSAVGLFQSVVGLVLLVFVNTISKRINGTGLW